MSGRTSVVIVDDHALFRVGVAQTLNLDDDLEVVGEGGSAAEALELVVRHRPDVVLLDINMPGNGIEAAKELLELDNAPKVMMLTVSEEDDDIMRALETGAVGYVLKGVKANDLIDAVKGIAAGESFVSPNLTLRILGNVTGKTPTSVLSSLTRQEEKTLRLMATGLSNREIGEQLGIVEKTVKYHVTRILKKLNARNRVEASLVAERIWGKVSGR
ncbi:response regulator transcription factor [Mesorhizobium sp. YM1C-6-2]|uniref:response regulator n=1 Tax=Mesorhizobium sp. YM1C-6-2 TaxID=1827501 RepID=UPI000EF22A9A|nr:response regulator transcription factor [Mesorhizobium sp. YM1C-6-2]RLP28380.1 DNA-binding response regulator [Mesorhizobium sp. YM1C-6-2]